MADEFIRDFDTKWVNGARSQEDPGSLAVGTYWMTMNMLSVGGVLSCRPGYRCQLSLPDGPLQGGFIFRPRMGFEQMLVVIAGLAYVADYPFTEFRVLEKVRFSTTASQVWFSGPCDQAARRTSTNFVSDIEVLTPPRRVVIIQDGVSAPAYWDGSTGDHIRNFKWETPIGGPMVWVGDRLWVANGNRVFASDIANPFSFREQVYLGGSGSFSVQGNITAMAKTPDVTSPQLLVFTDSNCTQLLANVRDRESWPTTDNFQTELFRVGAVGQRSIVSSFGQLSWFSSSGFTTLDMALAAKHTSRLPLRDLEMLVSKVQLSGSDLSRVAGGSYGPYILMSVPAADAYNLHTWVYQSAAEETVSGDRPPIWSGYWTGTRPVEWMRSEVPEDRLFYLSVDLDGRNRLWEAFQPDRLDNGCPITWAFWSRGYFGVGSPTQKVPGLNCRFRFSDLALSAIDEDLDVGVWFAGGAKGAFSQIGNFAFSVDRGSLQSGVQVTGETQLFGLKAQSRTFRTGDAFQQDDNSGVCGVEKSIFGEEDESFQLLVVGQGPASMRWVRAHAQARTEDPSANPDAKSGVKEEPSAVRFDGVGAAGADSLATLSAQVPNFTGLATYTATSGNYSATAVATTDSLISQQAADRAAARVAEVKAEAEVAGMSPDILGMGIGFEEA